MEVVFKYGTSSSTKLGRKRRLRKLGIEKVGEQARQGCKLLVFSGVRPRVELNTTS